MNSGRTYRCRTGGFTLLELLIAVVVFSIVLAAINAVFYGALRLQNKTTSSLDESWPLRHALSLLQQDLANIVTPAGPLSGTLQTSRLGGQSTATTTATPNQAMLNQPGQGSPEFHTATGVIDELSPWAEVQKVTYYLMPSTNGSYGKELVRGVTRNLLPSLQEQPVLTPLLTGVQSIFFYYYDGNQWQDSWDSTTATTSLPKAIKVQLLLASRESTLNQPAPIELVVPLWVGGASNVTAQATGGAQ
jgi:general secretion pathway protein J